MTDYSSVSMFFAKNSMSYPIVRILDGLREQLLESAITIKSNAKEGVVEIKMTTRNHFRFCDSLLKQFVYKGLSFDELLIIPNYTQIAKTSPANYVVLRISTCKDFNDNKLIIKYRTGL